MAMRGCGCFTKEILMRRWLAKLVIGLYLTATFGGIAAHAMNFGTSTHPAMYYFVWDMFCGWAAHEIRYHIVAEGESGTYYDLTSPPWSTFAPYGDLARAQYDVLGNALHKIAINTLKHTDHEPIRRILIAEEVWPKKYNLPDDLWAMRFDEPKDPHSYFWLKTTLDGDGTLVSHNSDYLSYLYTKTIANNPRLRADTQRGKPFFAVDPVHRTQSSGFGSDSYMGAETTWGRPSAN
jgi:hypothetical protein